MSKVVIDILSKTVGIVDFTAEEIVKMEEQQLTQEFEQSTQPSKEEQEQAKFELKTINLLIELGVI